MCTVIIGQTGMSFVKKRLKSLDTTSNTMKITIDQLRITGTTYRTIYIESYKHPHSSQIHLQQQ